MTADMSPREPQAEDSMETQSRDLASRPLAVRRLVVE